MKLKAIEDREVYNTVLTKMLGWKWLSFIDTPTTGTEGYPQPCRVRMLFSPKQLKDVEWQKYLQEAEVKDADGSEPLHYRYCSSMGPAVPPSLYLLIDE